MVLTGICFPYNTCHCFAAIYFWARRQLQWGAWLFSWYRLLQRKIAAGTEHMLYRRVGALPVLCLLPTMRGSVNGGAVALATRMAEQLATDVYPGVMAVLLSAGRCSRVSLSLGSCHLWRVQHHNHSKHCSCIVRVLCLPQGGSADGLLRNKRHADAHLSGRFYDNVGMQQGTCVQPCCDGWCCKGFVLAHWQPCLGRGVFAWLGPEHARQL
jgi:hypothetical protein